MEKQLDIHNTRTSEKEKDILHLRICGVPVGEVARRLNVPIAYINQLERKVYHSVNDNAINMSKIDRDAWKQAKFRVLINKALEEERVYDLDEKAQFLTWAIGDDYTTLPFQHWPYRITSRTDLIGIDVNSPVKMVIRAACQIWKSKRILIGVG